jgi:hypothetical protein
MKTLRHLNLDQFGQPAALIDKFKLRTVPRQKSRMRRDGDILRHRHLLQGIHSHRSRLARGRNVQSDEYPPSLRVCQFRTIVERRIVICLAREDDSQSLSLQRNAHQPRIAEYNVALRDAGRSACAWVRAAVRRIKNHHCQSFLRRSRWFHRWLSRCRERLRWHRSRRLWRRLSRRRRCLRRLRMRRKCLGSHNHPHIKQAIQFAGHSHEDTRIVQILADRPLDILLLSRASQRQPSYSHTRGFDVRGASRPLAKELFFRGRGPFARGPGAHRGARFG